MAEFMQRPGGYLAEGVPYAGGFLLPNLLLFGRVCKTLGMSVTPSQMIEVAHALETIDLGRREDVYHAIRALTVTHPRELELFDEAFRTFWRKPTTEWSTLDMRSLGEQRRQKKTQFLPPPAASPDDDAGAGNPAPLDPNLIAVVPTYSTREALHSKEFAEMTAEEIAQAKHLMAQLRWGLGVRRTQRLVRGKGAPHVVDARTSFRRNLRYAGEPLELTTRARKIKPRPLVLLCDISGSMERYTRLLLHFMHTLSNSMYMVESFVFSTRLTRITLQLRYKSVDVTLRHVGADVKDWGGGTRIGNALHDFNYRWSRRVLGRGAVVMLITDGWDRGDPDVLRSEIMRLQRNAHRLIWLNPLLGAPQYEPLTRGALAMRPYVDDFLPVRNLANLESLARELARVDWRRPALPPAVIPNAQREES